MTRARILVAVGHGARLVQLARMTMACSNVMFTGTVLGRRFYTGAGAAATAPDAPLGGGNSGCGDGGAGAGAADLGAGAGC